MAVAYAKDREQFGQPIGAFQAVKHHCADMAVRCEAAGAQLAFAACAERDGIGDYEGPAQTLLIDRRPGCISARRRATLLARRAAPRVVPELSLLEGPQGQSE